LIDKLITAPLWRILEAEGHVLEMNQNFQTLLQFLERNSEDASLFYERGRCSLSQQCESERTKQGIGYIIKLK